MSAPSPNRRSGAWQHAKRRTRRVQLWMKNSLSSMSSRTETVFEGSNEGPGDSRQATTDLSTPQWNDTTSLDEQEFAQYPPSELICSNIDDAMAALHEAYEQPVAAFVSKHDHDWILDGNSMRLDEQRRSRELVQELGRGPPQLDLLLAEHGLLESAEAIEDPDQAMSAGVDDHDDDEFGDFQAADTVAKSTSTTERGDVAESPKVDDTVPVAMIHVPFDVEDQNCARTPSRAEQNLFGSTSIYGILPLTDVTSPEGRFARRLLATSSDVDGDSSHELHDAAWDENFPRVDADLRVLQSTPWDHVPLVSRHPDLSLVDDFVTRQLSELDVSHAKVQAKLMMDILQRKHLLEAGNLSVRELDSNLTMAKMYAARTADAIHVARGSELDCSGIIGNELLLRNFDRRDQYEELSVILGKCSALVEQEQRLQERIDSFEVNVDCRAILQMASDVLDEAFGEEELLKLKCLDGLRRRAHAIFDTFSIRIDAVLRAYVAQVCQFPYRYSEVDYNALVNATEAVHRSAIERLSGHDRNTAPGKHQVSEQWSKSIQETLCFQADKCFARALLDPTDAEESEYDKDLSLLGFELGNGNHDGAKLLSLTHNLVTIRFAFESDLHYLPRVYHRLCVLLTDVLRCYDVFFRWHANRNGNGRTTHFLRETKLHLWKRCEEALVKCIDRYLHTVGKCVLFPDLENDNGDLWRGDMENQHDILMLTQQFLSLGRTFLDDRAKSCVTNLSRPGEGSELHTKLCDLFRRHVRAVHVAAMNSTGISLYKEDWKLMDLGACCNRASTGIEWSVEALLIRAVETESIERKKRRYWHNEFHARKPCTLEFHLLEYDRVGNPFLAFHELDTGESIDDGAPRNGSVQSSGYTNGDGWATGLLGCDSSVVRLLATRSISEGILKWFGRLLSLAEKLPLIIDDIHAVTTNLSDLYFMTVFRLCAGTSRNEEILLGSVPPPPLESPKEQREPAGQHTETTLRRRSSGSLRVGFGRRPSKSKLSERGKQQVSLATTIDAEICSPLSAEIDGIACVREFVERGQSSMEGIVNLQKIEQWMSDPVFTAPSAISYEKETWQKVASALAEREGAAWSCLLFSELLEAALRFTETCFDRFTILSVDGENGDGHCEPPRSTSALPFPSYVAVVRRVTTSLVELESRIASVRALMGRYVVQEILDVDLVWEASEINEQSNEYVESLCDRIASLWKLLAELDSPLPAFVRQKTFEHVVEGGYLSLLEGFSRVPFCSTEGRSLMSMDLSTFANGVRPELLMDRIGCSTTVVPPSRVSVKRGPEYVDAYIKVFYFPENDIMKWVVANHTSYQLNHCLALLTSGAYDRIEYENRDMSGLVWDIKALYIGQTRTGLEERS